MFGIFVIVILGMTFFTSNKQKLPEEVNFSVSFSSISFTLFGTFTIIFPFSVTFALSTKLRNLGVLFDEFLSLKYQFAAVKKGFSSSDKHRKSYDVYR